MEYTKFSGTLHGIQISWTDAARTRLHVICCSKSHFILRRFFFLFVFYLSMVVSCSWFLWLLLTGFKYIRRSRPFLPQLMSRHTINVCERPNSRARSRYYMTICEAHSISCTLHLRDN